ARMRLVAVADLADRFRLSFLNFQIERSLNLADNIATTVLHRKERILRHGLERLVMQHSQLSQRFDYRGRARALVVAVFDLYRYTQAVRPLFTRLDPSRVNAIC